MRIRERLFLVAGLVVVCLVPNRLWADAGKVATSAPTVTRYEAVAEAREDRRLGFTVPGKVAHIPVKEGQHVKAGQVLMELDDRQGVLAVQLAQLVAQSHLEVEAQEQSLAMAQLEEKRLAQLLKQSAAAPIEVERAKIRAKVEAIRLAKTKEDEQEAQIKAAQAEALHEQYVCKAPCDGVVESIVVSEGELVEALKPVLRLVATDPLLIQVWVPTPDTMRLKPGDPAWIIHPLLGENKPMLGHITAIAQVADSLGKRQVRIEVPNPQGLPAGGKVSVQFVAPVAALGAAPRAGRSRAGEAQP